MKKYPKILFITVNGWNNTTGTATIPSIIEGYPSKNIACIFIRPDLPNSHTCSSYYNISEKEVIKSIFNHNICPGNVVTYTKGEKKEMDDERRNRIKLKRISTSLVNYIRDVIWKLGKWENDNLKKYIDEFNPDVIAFPVEGMLSFLRLCNFILNYANRPYVLFFWDDNFTYKSHGKTFYRILLRRTISSLAKNCAASFAITPKMAKECWDYFRIKPTLITKPVIIKSNVKEKNKYSFPIRILYTGSLYIDRNKTIDSLIKTIKEINAEYNFFYLDIYTNSELTDNEKENYNIDGIVTLHSGVPKERIFQLQERADILLFVEALNGRYRNSARLSFSTKIIDYLSANRAIFAIGPEDIAPIEYLRDNRIAIVASNEEEIEDKLIFLIQQKDNVLNEYAHRAFEFGKKNHSQQIIFESFCRTIDRAVKKTD